MEDTRRANSTGHNKKRAQGRDEKAIPQNLPLKVRKLNPTNTSSYIQILGTGMDTQDTSPSVLLFFDKQRFIFNAGEGLQRYCTAHKIKLSKIDHIFLSRVCSETAGGLPGLLLTLAGMGEQGMSVKLWGSSDLNYLIEAMQSFIPNAAMVHSHCFGPQHNREGFTEPLVLIDDKVVKISAILVRPDYTVVKPGDISVVYVCELPEIKGKFDPEKAAALGLKPGPKYRQLQSGNSVKSDKKNIMVHPNDVLGPAIPGPIVILVDCPTLFHLQKLCSIQSVSAYYSVKSVKCIVHLSPSSVTMTVTYQDWMKKFHGVQHIMAGHEIKNTEIPILKSSAELAARLNYLCPKFFPSPGFGHSTQDSIEDSVTSDSISAENLLKFQLRPYTELPLDKSAVPSLMSSSAVVNELLSEIPEIADSAKQVSELCNGLVEHECDIPSCLENITREDMEVVLLGTGSSQPSKYRNVSSIYVNLFSKGGILLDCGEGSLGQLKRRFGVQGADDAVRSLRCIWISHIHADHHAGLARILSLRRELLKGVSHEPLIVIGPKQLKRFLDAYQNLEDLDMQFLDCSRTTEMKESNRSVNSSTDFQIEKKLRTVLEEAGLEALVSVPVVHCPQAYGIVVKSAERTNNAGEVLPGWKLVYSGDTRPCPELVEASRGATLLIHEATFEDSIVEEAIARNHSTTKEAIQVGESAGAYRIILTHFSQRYPKIPVFDEMHMQKTCVGFDLMSINLADLPVLPKVNPYFKLLFRKEMGGPDKM